MTQFPALYTIDTFGRRNLLLFTFPNMAWCLFAAAGCFQMNEGNSARLPLIAFFIYLFTAFYSPGEWSLFALSCAGYAYDGKRDERWDEVIDAPHRYRPRPERLRRGVLPAVAPRDRHGLVDLHQQHVLHDPQLDVPFAAQGRGIHWRCVFLPFLVSQFSLTPLPAFCLYGGLNILAAVMIFLALPETKQRTLEELDYIFAVPTRRHAAYQVRTWAPWFVRRYVLWRKDAVLEPLYHLEGVAGEDSDEMMPEAWH